MPRGVFDLPVYIDMASFQILKPFGYTGAVYIGLSRLVTKTHFALNKLAKKPFTGPPQHEPKVLLPTASFHLQLASCGCKAFPGASHCKLCGLAVSSKHSQANGP